MDRLRSLFRRDAAIGKNDFWMTESFGIVGPQDFDSLGSKSWEKYLDPARLREAWSPVEDSPWYRYQKVKEIGSLKNVGRNIKPRYSEGEERSQRGLRNLIRSGVLGKETAVILDSGGHIVWQWRQCWWSWDMRR